MANEEQYNKPERGGKPGIYQIEDAEGNKKTLVADSHPMADAYIRMGAVYVKDIAEWRQEQLEKRQAEIEAKLKAKNKPASSDKKGK